MAKKGQSENYDALGGIFSFLFEESKKPPIKRKPIRVKNAPGDTTSNLTEAITASLEKPGVFMSDQIVRELNSALDIKLGSVVFDQDGELKLTSKGLIDAIKDPAKFVQSAIDDQRATRKATRAAFLGSFMMDYVTTGWAQKYGNAEIKAGGVANTVANSEAYKVSRAVGQLTKTEQTDAFPTRGTSYPNELDYMSQRSLDLLGKKTFGDRWNTMSSEDKSEFTMILSGGTGALDAMGKMDNGSAWATMTKEQRDAYKKRVTNKQKISDNDERSHDTIQRYLAKKYSTREAQQFERATHKYVYEDKKKDSSLPVDIMDPTLYKTLEKQNIAKRIGQLGSVAPGSPEEEEKRTYEKMLLVLNMNKADIRKKIGDLNDALSIEKNPAKRRELENSIADAKDTLNIFNKGTLFGKVGQWEGYYNSLKEVWLGKGGTELAANVISGKFFRGDANTLFNPVEQKTVGGVRVNIAKGGKNRFGRAYNEMGENLYYLTPGSIFKTVFYNGEGFARLAYKQVSLASNLLSDEKIFGKMGESIFGDMMSRDIKDLDKFVDDTMNKLTLLSKNVDPKQLARIRKLLKGSTNFRKLANTFSMPFRFQSAINNIIQKRLTKGRGKIRDAILANPKLQAFFSRMGADKLLGKWVAGGGIRVLVQSVVTAVVGALGMTFGPVASAVVTALTYIATDLLMKILKHSLVLLKYMFIGIIALFALIILAASSSVGKFNKRNFAYSNAVPSSVVQCTLYEEEPVEGNYGDPGDIGDFDTQCVNGDTIEDIYARVASEMGLGTQLELVSCPGHDMCASIDWAWCYSASKIYCRADKLATVLYDCSILERLFIHELTHQIQSINGAPYDVDLREWGADYVSGNGGSYMFSTIDGCMRATQVPMLPSCTPEILKSIAYAEPEGYATACKTELRNYILSRFCN